MQYKEYDKNVDYDFFTQHDVTVEKLMPWQFRLTHPDVKGRFVWYPTSGALVYEKPDWGVVKVGEYDYTEEVYNVLISYEQSLR